MFLKDIKELKTGTRELRNFGLLVGGVFALLGLLFMVRGKAAYPWLLTPGLLLVAFGAIAPRTLKYIYLVWMGFALAIGFVASNVILTVFFFLVITSIGLLARLAGRDFLRLKLDRQAKSYWIPREHRSKAAEDYERQF
jgi:hypothetical protein